MADKVQFILEDLLEDSVYMMKKGVFSQGQLQQQMKKRQKMEINLVKSAHTLADHLQAIQFEYEQQRIRKYREENAEEYKLDPKYKKANTRDFTIVKRIIQLWDRTMHRYRYRIDLWKQYLSFCFIIKSRKVFYKALSHAVKFNPFELDLWLAGVYYEFQVVSNPWRARKVFHKALKINRQVPQFWVEYLRFEMQFAQKILERQEIMTKEEKVEIIGVEQVDIEKQLQLDGEVDNKDIDFSRLLKAVIQQSLVAMPHETQKQNVVREIIQLLNDSQWKESLKPTIQQLLEHVQKLLEQQKIVTQSPEEIFKNLVNLNSKKQFRKLREKLMKAQNFDEKFEQIKVFKKQLRKQLLSILPMKQLKLAQKIQVYTQWSQVMKDQNQIQQGILKQCLAQLSLKKQALSLILTNVIGIDPVMLYRFIINSRIEVPWKVALFYLKLNIESFSKMDMLEMLRRTEDKAYEMTEFLEFLVKFNQNLADIRANLELMKKVRALYPQKKQLISALTGFMSS